jgi:hypothetical protein
MSIIKITDHTSEALARLLQQYKNKPNIRKLLEVYLDQIQEIETMFCQLLEETNVFDAIGAQLDGIGEIVVQPRNGLSDDQYRIRIFVKIGKNVSEGEVNRVGSVFKILTQSAYVHLIVLNDAEIQLQGTETIGTTREEVNFIFSNMQEVVAAGVRISYILCADENLSYAYEGTNTSAPALGYDDGLGLSGGLYATLYTEKLDYAYAGNDVDVKGYGAGSLDPLAGGIYLA